MWTSRLLPAPAKRIPGITSFPAHPAAEAMVSEPDSAIAEEQGTAKYENAGGGPTRHAGRYWVASWLALTGRPIGGKFCFKDMDMWAERDYADEKGGALTG